MACATCGTDHGSDQPCPSTKEPNLAKSELGTPPSGPHALAREIADEMDEMAEMAKTVTRSLPSEETADPLIGTTVGSFRIVRRLGKGGMGTVYLAEQTVIGSKVAVKILHAHLASTPSLVQRFYAEARAVNLIGHENIVSIFDMNVVPPHQYYLIMEYLEGKPLTSLLGGPVSAEVAIPILTQVCDALQAAHSRGVVHRDLKPENIFLIRRGRTEHFVKILDFGIAKLYGQGEDRKPGETAAGMLVGTPEYMSPEQCTGTAVDGRADVYALGVISYLLAVGHLPFTAVGLTALLMAHREQVPPAPHDVNPKVPVPWSSATMRALAKRPQDRFQDAGELRDALEHVLESTRSRQGSARAQIPTPDPASTTPLLTPHPSDSRHIASFMAAVSTSAGQEMARLRCLDVSRGGVFLCAEGPLPPVFARVKLTLELADGPLACEAEVVRHVTSEQARAWNMSPGFGVQFVDTSPAFREAVARAVQGLPLGKSTPARPAARSQDDDAAAEPLLEHYRKRINGDHYVVLSMAQDAEIAGLRARERDARRDLESLRARPLSARQDAQALTALERVGSAIEVLGTAVRRAEYDAYRGNFKGVARCISAGLSVSEMESLRNAYLSSHQGASSKARVHFTTGQAWETKGSSAEALAEYERALTLDPVNLRYHQRYWALRRKVAGPRR